MRIVLLGAPGSGKGTQAVRLAAHYGVEHIGVGDLLRAATRDGSSLGEHVGPLIARGDLVSDELVLDLLWPRVRAAAAAGGWILDGFPRTLAQAQAAYRLALDDGITADAAVFLDADRELLLERLQARAQGRADDTTTVILHRLAVFEERTRPVADFYAERGILVRIDASLPMDDVTQAVLDGVAAVAGTA